jgi:hypothetical protein
MARPRPFCGSHHVKFGGAGPLPAPTSTGEVPGCDLPRRRQDGRSALLPRLLARVAPAAQPAREPAVDLVARAFPRCLATQTRQSIAQRPAAAIARQQVALPTLVMQDRIGRRNHTCSQRAVVRSTTTPQLAPQERQPQPQAMARNDAVAMARATGAARGGAPGAGKTLEGGEVALVQANRPQRQARAGGMRRARHVSAAVAVARRTDRAGRPARRRG